MDDRACCCPARPMVRVLMPATRRPYRVDLLLCGHHYRLSQWTLAAAEAVVQVLPGRRTADVSEMALL